MTDDTTILPKTAPPENWQQLCRIEPRLIELEQDIRREQHHDDRWAAYEAMKRRLQRLVGWESPNQALRNHTTYDIAHGHLLDLLEGVPQ